MRQGRASMRGRQRTGEQGRARPLPWRRAVGVGELQAWTQGAREAWEQRFLFPEATPFYSMAGSREVSTAVDSAGVTPAVSIHSGLLRFLTRLGGV